MRSVPARPVAATAAAGLLLAVATTTAARAHEEITPATFPTGRPVFLTLSAANEEGADLSRVTLRAPQGVSFGAATQQPPGWSAERSPDTITWTGGAVPPRSFQQWGFEIDSAPQPGPLRFAVDLGFADGSSHASQAEVTAVAPGGAVPSTEATRPGPTTTIAAPTTPPTVAEPETADDSGENLATAALIVAIIAAVLALLAVGLTARGRPPSPADASTGATPSTTPTQKEEQDW